MAIEANDAPTVYNSVYRHGVDEKRRIQIPARWRPIDPGIELTLVLWPKTKEGPCIRVLPPAQMARMMQDLDAIANSDPGKGAMKRFIGSHSVQAPLDKAGRICVPEELATKAGITEQAVLVGLLDRFEIWSPERFEKVTSADEVLAQDGFRMME